MSGVYWKKRRFFSRGTWKRMEEQKNPRLGPGEDDEVVAPLDVELPNPKPGMEYLRMRPYRFGMPDFEGLEDMSVYDSDNPDPESEVEDDDDDELDEDGAQENP
jgi:hypothetical protein